MKVTKNFVFVIVAISIMLFGGGAFLNAQVTIGADKVPEYFSILELRSNGNNGLRLPQIATIFEREAISTEYGEEPEMMGLTIFNMETLCVETWNGAKWISICADDGGSDNPTNPPDTSESPAQKPSSCGITASNGNMTFTAIADPNATGYEFFVLGVSSGMQPGNVLTLPAATSPANVAVKYYYAEAFLRPKMLAVTGGTFTIGAAVQDDLNGNPVGSDAAIEGNRAVTVNNFYMSEIAITQAQFEYVMGINPSYFQCSNNTAYAPSSAKPVEQVSWYDAIAFCNKLSIMEGKTPAYTVSGISDWAGLSYANIPAASNSNWDFATVNMSANGYRMPTEAEWEYAARGGNKSFTALGTPPDYHYAGGNDINTLGWYNLNSDDRTHVVKEMLPNALGLYDMSGNVTEWCWDWFGKLNANPNTDNPLGANGGTDRVTRGGLWNSTVTFCRVHDRNHILPFWRKNFNGFRVVYR